MHARLARFFHVYWPLLGWLMFIIICRWQWLDMPLERDEGEYGYLAQLLLQGVAPYAEAANMKLPGTSFMYALFIAIGGVSAKTIHLGLLFTNLLTAIGLYSLARQCINQRAASLAVGFFACMSLFTYVIGFAAHATHFVMLFVVIGLAIGYRTTEKPNLWRSAAMGLCLGTAILMKQTSLFFPIMGGLMLLRGFNKNLPMIQTKHFWSTALYSICVLLPYALLVLWTYQAGAFEIFWEWTIVYAKIYASGSGYLSDVQTTFVSTYGINIYRLARVLLIIILPILWFHFVTRCITTQTKQEYQNAEIFIRDFLFFSLLAIICVTFIRHHYFIQLIPAISLALAWWLSLFIDWMEQKKYLKNVRYFFYIPLIICMCNALNNTFLTSKEKVFDQVYGLLYFKASPDIAKTIKQYTKPTDRIGILGSEPQLLFLSERRSATSYLYTYALMEEQPLATQMQADLIQQIESQKPSLLVNVLDDYSWSVRPTSHLEIFDWIEHYLASHYTLVSVYDIRPNSKNTVIENIVSWHSTPENPTPPSYSKRALLIYLRKD